VLDALKRECVRASFFLLGRNAAAHPELATFRRKIDVFGIVADGMRKQDPPGAVRRVVGSA
jgi:hypothetical protein